MDVNGTRFHLLLGEADWAACDQTGTEWDGELCELTLQQTQFVFPTPEHDRPPTAADRRGADADRFGNVYWIDDARSGIEVRSTGTGRAARFWSATDPTACPPPREAGAFGPRVEPEVRPVELAGLAVTEDHYLVAGCLDPAGLLVFDLIAGGPPSVVRWPLGAFAPTDIARRPGGGVWVLDLAPTPPLAWELDRDLAVHLPAPAPPADGSFEPAAPGTAAASSVPHEAGHGPIALEGSPIAVEALAGGVLVLDENPGAPASILRLFRHGEPALAAETADAEISVRAHALAVTPAEPLGVAYLADEQGNQSFRFDLALEGGALTATLRKQYFPMRLYTGRGLVRGPKGILYDFTDGWIPLVHQPRRRHVQAAELVTNPLDGGEPGCVWHRLFLDGCVEAGSSVTVWSAASDDRSELLADPDWQLEPAPRPRAGGVELPYVEELAGYETHELLFQRARGRYMRVRLELRGDGRATPRLRALRASFPRFSYLEEYLPAVYREDAVSASFLDRYLANVEGFFTNVEDTVAAVQVLFDPDAAPDEALDWLASWFDAALDPAWDDTTRRLYVRHAVDLFRRRGTARGIELALHLGLEGQLLESELLEAPPPGARRPRVVESFRSRQTPGVVWGDPTDLGGPPVRAGDRWTPERGGVALDEAYVAYLRAAGITPGASERFTSTRPTGSRGRLWEQFAVETLGFVPQVPAADGPLARAWQGFLKRRYPNVGALNVAYGLVGGDALESLEDVPIPDDRPADGAALADWFQFMSVVVPMRGRAHRFTVLLPVPPGGDGPDADAAEIRHRAERIVEIQKPAHTTFDVRFFWDAFRIGEARLGTDTLVDLGSRAPDLLGRLVLGTEHLGETYLAGPPAADDVGRPAICAPTTAEEMQ